MGANVLGPRKTRAIAAATGLTVIRALVWSHNQSGRYAFFYTADHQHGYVDRQTGEWEIDPDPTHTAACDLLYGGDER